MKSISMLRQPDGRVNFFEILHNGVKLLRGTVVKRTDKDIIFYGGYPPLGNWYFLECFANRGAGKFPSKTRVECIEKTLNYVSRPSRYS